MSKTAVVINYSEQDEIFLPTLIKECRAFADQIIINYSDQQYDGTLSKEPRKYNDVDYAYYEFDEQVASVFGTRYFHNLGRFVGASKLKPSIERVLFLDGDEIPEGSRMRKFLEENRTGDAKIANYVYYKSPRYRALAVQDSAILLHVAFLKAPLFFQEAERGAMVSDSALRNATHDNLPLIHHYSWAKPMDVLEKKIKTWGHKNDRDWSDILDNINNFTPDQQDPIWGYSYKEVEDKWNLKIN